jgi:hypothetical protein
MNEVDGSNQKRLTFLPGENATPAGVRQRIPMGLSSIRTLTCYFDRIEGSFRARCRNAEEKDYG